MYVYVTDMLRIIIISGFSLFQRRRQENSSGGPSFSLGGRHCPIPSPPLPPLSLLFLPLPSLFLPFPFPTFPSPPLLLSSLPLPLEVGP